MFQPFSNFTKRDYIIWLGSLAVILLVNVATAGSDFLTLIATLLGVTALIFAAKGNVWAQFFMIVFSILYGVISYRFRYWGEMITYLGMTMPMAIWAAITWIKNPSGKGRSEVQIQKLSSAKWVWLAIATVIVTVVFYFILKYFDTPNLLFSTISVTTSFAAATLTMLRSSYYAVCYAANDLVLVVLWVFASTKNPQYIPVVVNFIIFFFNDMYGFISWRKREQNENS